MASDMYLKLGNIAGESADSVHKGEIDVLAWSWGMVNTGTFHKGTGGGSGRSSFQDVSITKYIDKATSNIMKMCATGEHLESAMLYVRKAGKTPLEYLTIEMKPVLITSYSTGGSGGEDQLTENFTMNFGEVAVKYQPQSKSGGKEGGTIDFNYKIAEHTE